MFIKKDNSYYRDEKTYLGLYNSYVGLYNSYAGDKKPNKEFIMMF
jgi:hypothetical protein